MIRLHTLADHWKFFFIGDPSTALEDGKKFGIPVERIGTLDKDPQQFAALFATLVNLATVGDL